MGGIRTNIKNMANDAAKVNERKCDSCGKPFTGPGFPMKDLDGPEPWAEVPGLEQCEPCYRAELGVEEE